MINKNKTSKEIRTYKNSNSKIVSINNNMKTYKISDISIYPFNENGKKLDAA